jgi:cell fate (sporulation/competence/biofilm development) regulator YmcA (YheA/YmcA/DUF963 family)
MKVAKIVFGNFAGIKDYQKLEKIYNRYDKIKTNPGKTKEIEKLKAEIKILIPTVEEGINRIVDIYKTSYQDMKENNAVYTTTSAQSFYDELLKIKENILNYKKEVEA